MEIDYDFDGSLKMSDVVEDFFHSPSTGLYVFRHPLVVDSRVLAAADSIEVKVEASPEKWLVNVPLADALRLLERLGGTALSLPEYFRVRRDAIQAGDRDMLASLESDQFIEMLATVFLRDRTMIHHPRAGGRLEFRGEEIPVRTPEGRYGWVHPDDFDLATGLPVRVARVRDVTDDTIKYWDTHTDIGRAGALMAVRGFVTSVGKISCDLGFPADAVSEKLTIRECRRSRPEGVLDERVLEEARSVLGRYYAAVRDRSLYARVPEWHESLLWFVERHRALLSTAGDVAAQVLKEDLRDALGIFWCRALADGELALAGRIHAAAGAFSGLCGAPIDKGSFSHFVAGRREALRRAIRERASIVFVLGHDNPDTDAIVSALAEAFRQHLLCGAESTFVPVVPGDRIPDEVRELLGPELGDCLIFTADEDYAAASRTGRPEWIMVDHNVSRVQPETRAIIDHHYPSAVCLQQRIPRRILFAGSTSTLVALRIYGLGLEIPRELARVLHGATLMDTENRFPGKMTPLDDLVMDRLKPASGMGDESAFYRGLMRRLITCYDADRLFVRDYKEDWCFFGFAVAKGIEILDPERAGIVRRLRELAVENNARKNLPLTLLKVVDYAADAETIRRETMFPVFARESPEEFREAVRDTIVTIVRHESGPGARIERGKEAIEYSGVGTQLSRKKLAPVLDPVVNAFHRYFYSPSAGFYFKRDFLRRDRRVEEAARRHGIVLHADEDGVVVGNPAELKFLLQELGLLCASPAEYFHAYYDALAAGDERMAAHLTSPRYLETLDMIVEDRETIVEHARIVRDRGAYSYEGGTRRRVRVPVGEPGLFDPRKIDRETGLPAEVEDPRQYGQGLWRYWSPDSDRAWALRSSIFAYGIPALDLKFGFGEALPRLAIRPCVRRVVHPRVRVSERGGKILVEVEDA
ncbi:MAG: DHH family phosphoesterase [Planctomycetes bacterium]|nr:DHH family phosphoesterase [Planctomycetota bacterium]